MAEENFDLVVLGGGPGGYVAAIRAAQLGLKTAVVEAAELGGICLNWGCIPTKTLLRTAEVMHLIQHAGDFGITVEKPSFDLKAVVQRSRGVAKQLSSGVAHLLKKNKIMLFAGFGALQGQGRIAVTKDGKPVATLAAKHIIIATGARARTLPGLEADGKLVWTYREAMVPDVMPQSLLIVGSGAIGIEFASFYRTLGAAVTVVEIMDRVLPVEDEEISLLARKAFEKQGMRVMTGAKVVKLDKGQDSVTCHVETGGKTEAITVDRVIMAVGIVANIEKLGLDTVPGVKLERGQIVADDYLRTGEPGVYAIGDVTGAPWLAHKASHEGIVCVEKIAGLKNVHPMIKTNIPGCTYCYPQVASVGLTEKAAREKGYDIKVGRFPFIGNGKAIALGEPEGLVKTVFDAKTGELLGAHMVGTEVTELIQGYVIGKTAELTEAEFMETIFPHPTLSEMMHESVLNAYDKTIHF